MVGADRTGPSVHHRHGRGRRARAQLPTEWEMPL